MPMKKTNEKCVFKFFWSFLIIYRIKNWNNTKYIALPAQHLLDNLQVIGIKPLNTTYN